ncbi:MAG: transglutaminase domain-containing protein [Pirellulaceae bacterium]|nr:transglutaminase domain-containing protein [Pirellulaceae bacterium]
MSPIRQALAVHLLLWLGAGGLNPIAAQQIAAIESPLKYVAPKTFEMVIGVRITASEGSLFETSAQTVFPTDWPEQTVEVLDIHVPRGMQHSFRDLPGGNRQWLLVAPLIQAPQPVEATIKVRFTKSQIAGPEETAELVAPKRPDKTIRQFLLPSPQIDPNLGEIKKIVKQIDSQQPSTDWRRVEQLYDWVRDNIVYTEGDLKTLAKALRERKGDCEEMTGIFVALCRAARVPARCVWIPNHCYPEFYLEASDGRGYWFPCQVAGTRAFGSMPDYLPILQKGDRFKIPERPETLRYLSDYLTSKKVTSKRDPKVEFIRQLLGDAANLPAPDQAGQANLQPQFSTP